MIFTIKRYPLLYFVAAVACFNVFSPSRISATTKPDFNGTWKLDHQASSSLEPLMDKIGAGFVERKLAEVAPHLKLPFIKAKTW
jgi:hypothetical protein